MLDAYRAHAADREAQGIPIVTILRPPTIAPYPRSRAYDR